MKKQDFVMTWDEIQKELQKSKKGVGLVDLEVQRRMEHDLEKYKWLYNVACHIIHDSHGMELEEVKKSIEDLWVLKEKLRKEGKTNDNK